MKNICTDMFFNHGEIDDLKEKAYRIVLLSWTSREFDVISLSI